MTKQVARRLAGPIGIEMKRYFALLAILLSTVASAADFNVQRSGVPQFCAPSLQVTESTYNFTGTCVAPPPVGSCPAGRQTVGDVSYRYGLGASDTVRGVDLTQAKNIWGRTSPSDPIADFPFRSYFAVLKNFDKRPGSYVAAKFTVSPTTNNTITGMFGHGETLPGPSLLTMVISRTCGDFSQQPETLCSRANQPPGGTLAKYRRPGSFLPSPPYQPGTPTFGCTIDSGDYYVNIKAASTTGPGCAANANSCPTTVSNNWSN
jgi:hypothetical protein